MLILYFLFKIMRILAQVAQVGSSPDLAGAPERRYRGSTHVQVTSGASANRAAPHRSKNSIGVFSEHLSTTHPFKGTHGLLLKIAPATGPKTVQGFFANTCTHQISISKSARVAFQNCACHRSKNKGFL